MVTAIDPLSTMSASPQIAVTGVDLADLDALELVQVSLAAWRVYTAQVTPECSQRLLGCIDQRGEVFEMMELGDRFRWHTFASLHEALEHAALRANDLAAQNQVGELAWLT